MCTSYFLLMSSELAPCHLTLGPRLVENSLREELLWVSVEPEEIVAEHTCPLRFCPHCPCALCSGLTPQRKSCAKSDINLEGPQGKSMAVP